METRIRKVIKTLEECKEEWEKVAESTESYEERIRAMSKADAYELAVFELSVALAG